MISATFLDRGNMFVYSGTECSYSVAHVLHIAGGCNKVHNVTSSACSKMFYLIDGGSNGRLKTYGFLVTTKVMYTYTAFFAGIIAFGFWKKGWLCRRFNNIIGNAIP